MKFSRRHFLVTGGAALAGGAAVAGGSALLAGLDPARAQNGAAPANPAPAPSRAPTPAPDAAALPYTPVVTPNGTSLPWEMKDGVKEFHLIAEPIRREFAPGMEVNLWGYNGQSPGPTIEAVEGDRVRLLVTNKLPEGTTIHWHGVLLPNGMDGVSGLTQPRIAPGETWAYEFTLRQHGTQMYHSHSDEMLQMALGLYGFFIIHPKDPPDPRIDRDFAIFLGEWAIDPGTFTPNPNIMTDFNIFTFNSRAFPGTDPLVAKLGDRVRIRLGNLSMDNHPMHLHGHKFFQTGTDGGPVPPSSQRPLTTIDVPVGSTVDIEFVADNPGDWAFHCHKSHHTMNAMSHDIPNMIGVDQGKVEDTINKLVPGYMAMGASGMSDMADMAMGVPKNTLPMMSGDGPFGSLEMGGMFTVVKIRENLTSYADPGWYREPDGTRVWKVS
ncbi:MAG: copper oxidase [Verrucomicrobiota bacterium]